MVQLSPIAPAKCGYEAENVRVFETRDGTEVGEFLGPIFGNFLIIGCIWAELLEGVELGQL